MNFIQNSLVYLLLLVFDVKTIVNEAEKLESCVRKIATSQVETNENKQLLMLIEKSSVILKAFCSENLINFAESNDDESGMKEDGISLSEGNDVNDLESYDDYYFYKSDDTNIRTLMTFTPLTVYKGFDILRQLELFSSQDYFLIKGQLNATLELDRSHRLLYQKKCYGNPKINKKGRQTLNENHLIEKQLRLLIPGQLIVFGRLDDNHGRSNNRFVVKTSGVTRWKPHVENFIWNNLGWSSWGKWSPCTKSCEGIQQRFRHCQNRQNKTTIEIATYDEDANKMEKSQSASTTQQPNQQLCNGYNIEQRKCNLFECKDAVNLLSLANNTELSSDETSAHINHDDFTIMFTIRSHKFADNFPFSENQHLMSLRSNDKQSSLTISLFENGMKVVQEKDNKSDMFSIKLNLFDLQWHQISFSFRNDGLITCYADCIWDSSFVMAKGSFEVPSRPSIEMNSKLNGLIEWKQLNLLPGNHERSQCSNERTPIYDNNMLLEKMFNDEAN